MCTYSVGGDVGQVGGNTGGVDDIVEGELVDKGAELEEQGQGLRVAGCISWYVPQRRGDEVWS